MAQHFFATLDEPGNAPGGGQADITMADKDSKPDKEGAAKGKPDTDGDNHDGSEEDRGLTDATMDIADITIPDHPLRLRPRTHEIVIYDTNDAGHRVLRKHPRGSFIYRLAGRDRQKSASYYTPQVLTQCLVKYALKELLGSDRVQCADDIPRSRCASPPWAARPS
jgi:hypothetical protein